MAHPKNPNTDDTRYASLTRILRLARRLEGARSIDLDALATEFEVNVRTIRRYLMALERAGYELPTWRRDDTQADYPVPDTYRKGNARW